MHFILVLKGKTGKEMPESSKLEFLVKFSANSFQQTNQIHMTTPPGH